MMRFRRSLAWLVVGLAVRPTAAFAQAAAAGAAVVDAERVMEVVEKNAAALQDAPRKIELPAATPAPAAPAEAVQVKPLDRKESLDEIVNRLAGGADPFENLSAEDIKKIPSDKLLERTPQELEREKEVDALPGFSHAMGEFNSGLDKYAMQKVAMWYRDHVWKPIRDGIRRFFDNFDAPQRIVDNLLVGHFVDAGKELVGFIMNTLTAGFFDLRHDILGWEKTTVDFGQVLAVWFWERSKALWLPFFPMATVRDNIGSFVDGAMNPWGIFFITDFFVRAGMEAANRIDQRSRMMEVDYQRYPFKRLPWRYYLMQREEWLLKRAQQIERLKATSDAPKILKAIGEFFSDLFKPAPETAMPSGRAPWEESAGLAY